MSDVDDQDVFLQFETQLTRIIHPLAIKEG